MKRDETDATEERRKRRRHLRVPVFPDEAQAIEKNAERAGMSVARYLREVGQGYKIMGVVDYEHVRELARINGDLGRLGGLLKLWLTDDPRTARFGDATILALLAKIEEKQDELGKVMMGVVRPRAEP
ncbi:conjugal transfer transcriptional regulator TraJ [Salmonella enterica]|nr:conjugal transfer transcriptional regulator TraJ [Salmonella enterica]HDV3697360.1 conjugal transfer transcriptional regulator TraJ [Escherichia coli]